MRKFHKTAVEICAGIQKSEMANFFEKKELIFKSRSATIILYKWLILCGRGGKDAFIGKRFFHRELPPKPGRKRGLHPGFPAKALRETPLRKI